MPGGLAALRYRAPDDSSRCRSRRRACRRGPSALRSPRCAARRGDRLDGAVPLLVRPQPLRLHPRRTSTPIRSGPCSAAASSRCSCSVPASARRWRWQQRQGWPRFWRRWLQIAGCALLVSLGSAWMFPRSYISFGVLHGIALMLIVTRATARWRRVAVAARPGGAAAAAVRPASVLRHAADRLDRPSRRAGRSPRTTCRCCRGWV